MSTIDTSKVSYESQLENKLSLLNEKLYAGKFKYPDIEVFRSPLANFRMRAEFRIWHEGEQTNYAMHHQDTKKVYTITDFPIASDSICKRMAPLLKAINQSKELRHRLFQVEFLSTTLDQVLISLIYHRPLAAEWELEALELGQQLDAHIIGRSRKQKVIVSQDYVMEQMTVDNTKFHYQQLENSFTQPNAAICQKMLQWAVDQAKQMHLDKKQDLLELYCGNGNFTLPLATQFRKVLATEVSKTSVRSANYNIEKNAIDNIDIIRLSSEETVQALNKQREFRRLREIDLDAYKFSTVFVDPPRAGLDTTTLKLVQQFDQIIYISCNPETFIQNMQSLNGYSIQQLAVFDQFPYTHHLELGAVLSKDTL